MTFALDNLGWGELGRLGKTGGKGGVNSGNLGVGSGAEP